MGYTHKGKVLDNGVVDTGQVIAVMDQDLSDAAWLTVRPEDDGLHITDFNRGDFEWWYFDVVDRESGCFLKIVMHIGTDPLKTRVFPQLAVSVNTPEGSESITRAYALGDINAGIWQCHISIRNEIKIRAIPGNLPEYAIEISVPRFSCSLRFTGHMEGWKPLGNEVRHRKGKKKGSFSWVVPMPCANVEGDFSHEDMNYRIKHGTGYHDHNYIRVDGAHPLHLDDLITRWYWGKFHAGGYTVVFMDTRCRTNPMRSLMVAADDRIIYSANNLMECAIPSSSHDESLKVDYPGSIEIRSTDPQFPFRAVLKAERILDRKDLLEGVNPFLKFLIHKLVSRPAYHGILAGVRLQLQGEEVEGYGNYESMAFRNK